MRINERKHQSKLNGIIETELANIRIYRYHGIKYVAAANTHKMKTS